MPVVTNDRSQLPVGHNLIIHKCVTNMTSWNYTPIKMVLLCNDSDKLGKTIFNKLKNYAKVLKKSLCEIHSNSTNGIVNKNCVNRQSVK